MKTYLACTIITIGLVKTLFFFSQKVCIFFLFLNKNICCGYSLEAPQQGASNKYPQHKYLSRNKKTVNLIPTHLITLSIGSDRSLQIV